MSPGARSTLRFWAVAGSLYGVLLAAAVAVFVPWKTPWINAALIAYGALWPVAGHGLWRGRRWGWRLAVAGAFVGLASMTLVASGLIASWAYLHGIYGDFGFGASIGALLFATVALQVLGLIPALALRGLLRREVREAMGAGAGWIKAVIGLGLLPVLAFGVGHLKGRLPTLAPLPESARALTVGYLRAAIERAALPDLAPLAGLPVGAGPLYVTLWQEGQIVARVTGEGDDLAGAVAQAGASLLQHPRLQGRAEGRGRLKIDRVVGVGDVLAAWAPVVALSVNPGLDGLRRTAADTSVTLLPDDLVRQQTFGLAPLVPGIREMRFGLDGRWALDRLGGASGTLARLRTEGFVEYRGAALPVVRGNTPPDATGPPGWEAAARAGGEFILRQLMRDGRFHYQYFPYGHRHPPANDNNYSLPRHSGTVYALALLHGLTGVKAFRVGAEHAIKWLDGRIPKLCGDPSRRCVVKGKRFADLGSTALTLVGMLEYQRRTGDARYAPTTRKLLNFVLWLQKPSGDFFHMYDVTQDVIRKEKRLMFYSEEAALALVMAHQVLGDAVYLEAAERALNFLTGPKYDDFFLGRFIYGADHWTCIAADEAWPHLKHAQYLDFCLGYTRFIRRLQYEQTGWDNADYRGHYGFTGFMVPQAPAAAGFTEAVVSTWTLSVKHGRPDPSVYAQASDALDALTRDRIRAENSWMMPRPRYAAGGIRRSLVEGEVRIDFTQHAASALIRGARMPLPGAEQVAAAQP